MDQLPSLLVSVREETERLWADPYLGLGWQPGTRWRGGLTDDEVAGLERDFGLTFPPDYRLFLQTLHTTDPERVEYGDGRIRTLLGRPFRDWQGERGPIDQDLAWPLDGLLWSIEADRIWTSRWGERPESREGRAELIRDLAKASPPLIPVMGHRYLVGDPPDAGNPVLSIYGADVIVYAPTFAAWLVDAIASMVDPALRGLLAGEPPPPRAIPFWQDIIDDEGWSRDIAPR